MADIAVLTALIEPEAKALGFDVVRVIMFGGDEPTLQVMAERPATRQLTIDDCANLSRRISERLDALEEAGKDPIDHAYRLEVSSPGIDRPLTRAQDYADWAGHDAKIELTEKLDGRQRFTGVITGVDGDLVSITDKQDVTHNLPIHSIESAKLVLTDRLIAESQTLSAEGVDETITVEEDD